MTDLCITINLCRHKNQLFNIPNAYFVSGIDITIGHVSNSNVSTCPRLWYLDEKFCCVIRYNQIVTRHTRANIG